MTRPGGVRQLRQPFRPDHARSPYRGAAAGAGLVLTPAKVTATASVSMPSIPATLTPETITATARVLVPWMPITPTAPPSTATATEISRVAITMPNPTLVDGRPT